MSFCCCRSFCHLHQRIHPFLHSCSSTCTEHNNRAFFFRCKFKCKSNPLSYFRTHTSHEESAVHHTQNSRAVSNLPTKTKDSFIQSSLLSHYLLLFFISVKCQRVSCLIFKYDFFISAFQNALCSLFCRHRKVPSTIGTNILIVLFLFQRKGTITSTTLRK